MRRRVFDFLHHFEARGLRLQSSQHELWDLHDATAAELAATQKKVEQVFATGFMFESPRHEGQEDVGPDDIRLPLTFPSLRFGAFVPSRKQQRGRFTLKVEAGRLRDLVAYLAMWLLTTEQVAVSRCTAPAYRDWASRCDRFVVWRGQGRPPKVCSPQCGARVKAKRVAEQQRREREAWKAAQKKNRSKQKEKK